jgi:hypothetical protein
MRNLRVVDQIFKDLGNVVGGVLLAVKLGASGAVNEGQIGEGRILTTFQKCSLKANK